MTYEGALTFDQKWTEEQAFNDLERYLLREEKPAMKAVAIAMKALERQIPKKPIAKHYEEAGERPYIKFTCPNCNKGVSPVGYDEKAYQNRFCHKCGQAIDWSEEDE